MPPLAVTHTRLLDQPALQLRSPEGAEATVLLYGGHVVSFRTSGGDELLYLSPQATTAAGTPVRGGVPVIFPQFDRRGPEFGVPRHGFARTHLFEADTSDPSRVRLTLRDDDSTRVSFPHAFELTLSISLSAHSLTLGFEVQSRAAQPLSFTCALHTYLRIQDVGEVAVQGLDGHRYEDAVRGGLRATEADETLRVRGELDRVYAQVHALDVRDQKRLVRVEQRGFEDAVVWNPGPDRAAQLADLPDDGYRHMLCVEAARVFQPVALQPGGVFEGEQKVSALPPRGPGVG